MDGITIEIGAFLVTWGQIALLYYKIGRIEGMLKKEKRK